ncbi:MAG: hypothetical protein QOI77_2346 [Blastocatellia bacterium]|nr:hypothetical protein [Blastocatellia bacterium]
MATVQACFLLIVALVGLLGGQTRDLQATIENSIKVKEPAWELSAKEAQTKSTIYRWKSGRERVEIEVFVTASPGAAAAKFQDFARHIPVPPKEKVDGLGDEALLWQSPNTDVCMLLFRRSNVFFHINGSLPTNAKRFAKHLDDLLANK